MKTIISNTIVLLVFLASTLNTKAQTKEDWLKRESIINIENETINKIELKLKSVDETTLLLDSILEISYYDDFNSSHYYNKYFKYDKNGLLIEKTKLSSCLYCATGGNGKTKYEYYDDGKRIISIIYKLNLNTSEWHKFAKQEHVYDLNGRLLSHTGMSLDTDSGFVDASKTEYTYNKNGEQTSKVKYDWDNNLNDWIFTSKLEWEFENDERLVEYGVYEYDLDSNFWNPIRVTNYLYDKRGYDSVRFEPRYREGTFYDYKKIEFAFDSVGNEIESASYLKENGIWKGSDKTKKMYDEKGNQTVLEYSSWSETNSNWLNQEKTEWFFSNNNQSVLEISYRWEDDDDVWVNRDKIAREFNANNQLITLIVFRWDKTLNNWYNRRKTINNYDVYGNILQEVIYNWYNNSWTDQDVKDYYYSLLSTNNSPIYLNTENIAIYPNPANETFTIESSNSEISYCKLYNSTGKWIKTLIIENGINTYNISALKSGLYFIHLQNEDGIIVKKLVVN